MPITEVLKQIFSSPIIIIVGSIVVIGLIIGTIFLIKHFNKKHLKNK